MSSRKIFVAPGRPRHTGAGDVTKAAKAEGAAAIRCDRGHLLAVVLPDGLLVTQVGRVVYPGEHAEAVRARCKCGGGVVWSLDAQRCRVERSESARTCAAIPVGRVVSLD